MTSTPVVHMVCTDAFAGVERLVLAHAEWAARQGTEVHVIGGAEGAMRGPLVEAGARWVPARTRSEALAGLVSTPRRSILVTHMTEADLLGAMVRRPRALRQVSWRHFASPRGSRAAVRALGAWSARGLAGQVAVSEYVASHVDGACVVVRSGVPVRPATDVRRHTTVVIAQRLEPEKDTATAVRAWSHARLPAPWRLVIAGDGSERQALERLVQRLGVDGSVDFLGYRADVAALLSSAAMAVAPTPREGLGLSAIEAMAAGVPVVASAAGGHLETVGAVAPELLFTPADAASAARVIARLADDRDARDAHGTRLRAHQRRHLSADTQHAAALDAVMRAGTSDVLVPA